MCLYQLKYLLLITEEKPMTNIIDLKKDVSDLMQEIEKILDQRSQSTDLTEPQEDYYINLERIKKITPQLNDLQLKMTIIAPMSAGKSTIINAIIGHELLPTSASAMTTIPTEIILDKNINEPILTLDKDVFSVSNNTIKKLKKCIKAQKFDEIKEQLGSYPHLIDLAEKIGDGKIKISDESKGYKKIREDLTIINSIFRLFNLLIPDTNPLYELNNCPQIKTPFDYNLTSSNETEYMGNLVIIDTPGPNEAKQNLTLAPIVKKQLTENADLILIVLDFTQLNTESADKIRTEVNNIIKLINKENLYIIVNKIDQRKKKDPLNSEKLREFILSQFDLDNNEQTQQKIFEISGRQALCASAFMNEYHQNSGQELKDLETAEPFAEEIYGIDWEEELEASTPAILRSKADKLWDKSGFSAFTDNAIKDILLTILPKLIKTSIGLGDNVLKELREELKFKLNSLKSDKYQNENAIKKLEDDQHYILTKKDVLNKKFQEQIQYLRTSFEEIIDEMESNSFADVLKPQIQNLFKKRKIEIKEFKFLNELEAEKFKNKIYEGIVEFLKEWFSKYEDRINATIEHFETRINHHVNKYKIKDKLNEMRTRLKNQFDFDITYQISKFDNFSTFIYSQEYNIDINADVPLLGKIHNNVAVNLGKLVNIEIPVAEDEYKIYINEYVTKISKIIEDNIQKLAKQVESFIDEEDRKFTDYISKIESLINDFIKTLEDSIKEQNLSQEDLDAITQRIQQLFDETDHLINQTNQINSEFKELTKSNKN